jgi:hypothetical protein
VTRVIFLQELIFVTDRVGALDIVGLRGHHFLLIDADKRVLVSLLALMDISDMSHFLVILSQFFSFQIVYIWSIPYRGTNSRFPPQATVHTGHNRVGALEGPRHPDRDNE